jgi:plastocyanin
MRIRDLVGSRALRLLSALALVGFMAACSSSSTPAAPSAPPTSAPATSTVAGGTTLQQGTGDQLVFSPTTLTVKHGTTITVSNVSASTLHTFTITGKGIDITNNGGQSQQVAINLPPGTYPFICRFHVSSGMKGTLVVT